MRSIVRGLPRNRTKIDKRSRKTLGIRGRIDKRDRFERFEPDARGFGVARFGFRDDQGRRNEIEPVRGVAPPLPAGTDRRGAGQGGRDPPGTTCGRRASSHTRVQRARPQPLPLCDSSQPVRYGFLGESP